MDRGQEQTEAILKKIEKRITEEYAQAEEEIEATLADYFRRFKKKDETWQKWVEEGTKTAKEYEQWRIGQMAVGKTWQNQRDAIAKKLADVNAEANTIARSYVPDIYVTNYTYSLNQVGRQINVSSSFTQYSQEAINRLVLDDPEVAPPAGKKVQQQIAEGKAIKWNKHKLQSVMVQGIMQGESIPKLATRLATTVGDSDRKASIRNARTMATGVQNAGRIDCYKRAESKGVKMKQMWLATHDDRTRHSHRWLDGETQPVGGTFSNGCRFPADPQGAPAEIYNCRCTLRGVVDGLQRISGKYRDDSAMGGSYDVWREGDSKSNKITRQEEIAKAIKSDYIRRYRGSSKIDEEDADNLFENQRAGRNKSTQINKTLIESGQYRNKFDSISDNVDVVREAYQDAKKMLYHRSGSKLEDMYWIDGATGKTIAKELDQKEEGKVFYSKATTKAISKTKDIIAMHNHSGSMPPSIADFNSAYDNGYRLGMAICHDGTIYGYTSNERVPVKLYDLYIAEYKDKGYSEKDAQLHALETIMENYDIHFWEM